MGFYLMAPAFLLYPRRRGLAGAFLGLGLLGGGLMGMARIVQGGHFLSDIVWSGGIVYLTGLFLSCLITWNREPRKLPCMAQH
jgi:membrane-associated PAP2 superfamily phosphatase